VRLLWACKNDSTQMRSVFSKTKTFFHKATVWQGSVGAFNELQERALQSMLVIYSNRAITWGGGEGLEHDSVVFAKPKQQHTTTTDLRDSSSKSTRGKRLTRDGSHTRPASATASSPFSQCTNEKYENKAVATFLYEGPQQRWRSLSGNPCERNEISRTKFICRVQSFVVATL